MRLFYALPLSDETRASLEDVMTALRRAGVRGNFTRPENLHITLHFLGEQPPSAVDTLSDILLDAACPTFALTVASLGVFDRSGILWAGIRPSRALQELYAKLGTSLSRAGFAVERRAYRPHLTLVREYALPQDFALPELPPLTVTADCAVLMESSRVSGKLCYSPVSMIRLP